MINYFLSKKNVFVLFIIFTQKRKIVSDSMIIPFAFQNSLKHFLVICALEIGLENLCQIRSSIFNISKKGERV